MTTVPAELKYTREHEWVRVEDGIATIGLTDFAQEQLGDIVFVDMPGLGAEIKQMETCGAIESVKAASDIYAPVSGTVTAVNDRLSDKPELVNESPYDEGWIVKAKVGDIDELNALLSPAEYETLLASAETH